LNIDSEAEQLIMFDKKLDRKAVQRNQIYTKKKPNINIIFIDTMSRPEFHLGMVKTLKLLKNISKEGRKVYDYKLFQSISHQTYNHIQNLYNGAYPTMELMRNMSYMNMTIRFFQSAKQMGYMTGYSRDMCYAYDWTWAERPNNKASYDIFMNAVQAMQLDDTGIGLPICEMANSTSGNVIMFLNDGKCLNGKFYLQDQIDYHLRTQKRWIKNGVKFITHFETCVNHRDGLMSGKPLDELMSAYLKEALDFEDTLTILFSDHGNGIAEFAINYFPEGFFQRFHPFMIIVPPKNYKKFFTDEEMTNLELNQDRLVTMREVHYLLTKFVLPGRTERDGSRGLLSPVSENRTCQDINFFDHNSAAFDMCICEWQNSQATETELVSVKHEAQNYLNSQIKPEHKKCCKEIVFSKPETSLFIKSQKSKSLTQYTGVLKVKNFGQKNVDISFSISVQYDAVNNNYTVVSYQRLDLYSRFQFCAENCSNDVVKSLCIC